MEKGVTNLMEEIREAFALKDVDIRSYSPLVLAYIGDGIYELVIRSLLVGHGNAHASTLHKKASSLVNAAAQSAMTGRIKEQLTKEEQQIFRRGRNANTATMAKHASVSDYRRATGFEALMGYLYLSGQTERLLELVKLGLEEEACGTKN